MRSFLAAASLLLVTGCSAAGLIDASPDQPSQTPSSSTSPTPGPAPAPAPSQRSDGDSAACEEVVAGINAFNQGDYAGTVEHFEKAVPLAEAEDDGSAEAEDLVRAVHYYADLAPEDYPAASASSPEFARWKAVTLGQCVDDAVPSEPTSPGIEI